MTEWIIWTSALPFGVVAVVALLSLAWRFLHDICEMDE